LFRPSMVTFGELRAESVPLNSVGSKTSWSAVVVETPPAVVTPVESTITFCPSTRSPDPANETPAGKVWPAGSATEKPALVAGGTRVRVWPTVTPWVLPAGTEVTRIIGVAPVWMTVPSKPWPKVMPPLSETEVAVSTNEVVPLTPKLTVTVWLFATQARLLVVQLVNPLNVVVALVLIGKSCPVTLSVTSKPVELTFDTVPVTSLTSRRLPSVPTVVLSVTVKVGSIVKVLVAPAVASIKELATLKSIAIFAGWPEVRTAAVLKGTVTEVGFTTGDSSHTEGVAAAVQEFVVSVSVVPGSTLIAAVDVPKVIRTAV